MTDKPTIVQDDPLLSPEEAAEYCHCSESTIRGNKLRIGHMRISAGKKRGKLLFRKSALDAWLKSNEVEAR